MGLIKVTKIEYLENQGCISVVGTHVDNPKYQSVSMKFANRTGLTGTEVEEYRFYFDDTKSGGGPQIKYLDCCIRTNLENMIEEKLIKASDNSYAGREIELMVGRDCYFKKDFMWEKLPTKKQKR